MGGVGLCPFCGSPNVSYNTHYHTWRCNRCEKSFPTPSYGPDRLAGKPAPYIPTSRGQSTSHYKGCRCAECYGKHNHFRLPLKGLFTFVLIVGLIGAVFASLSGIEPFNGWRLSIESWVNQALTSTNNNNTSIPNTSGNSSGQWHEGRLFSSDGSYLVDGSREPIIMKDNRLATDPTYAQLLAFLKSDTTETNPYTGGIYAAIPCPPDKLDVLNKLNQQGNTDRPKICIEYAELLHNNAEAAGIKAGIVLCTDHAINAFQTTDRGLILIDDTGFIWSFNGVDAVATVLPNKQITLEPLWPEDKLKYSSINYEQPVYFEEIVWEGK